MTPRYTHDCPHCKYLGQYKDQDLYVHDAGSRGYTHGQTVIARSSSDGPDYESGMWFAFGASEALSQARLRAQEAGIIDYPFDIALSSVRPSDEPFRQEFLQASVGHPLSQLLEVLETGDPFDAFVRFEQQTRNYIAERAQLTQQPEPLRFADDFRSRVLNFIRLARPQDLRTLEMRVYDLDGQLYEKLSSELSKA